MRNSLRILLTLSFFILPILANSQDVTREQVVFRSGDNVLSGTLVLPTSAQDVPVLLFMGGIDEWGDIHTQRQPFIEENLLSVFPPSGIGVFYYDPRGIGESDGRWGRATLNDFADDAKAAISYLSQRREVDRDRIGIVGHGEDGWVVQIVAATSPQQIKLMASLAGPTFDPTRQLVNEYHSEYVCNEEDSTAAYEKAVQKAQSHQNWVSAIPITKRWRHMKMKLDFNPAEYIGDIEIPALFVFGGNDGQVYPSWAVEELNEIFPNSIPPNFTIYDIGGVNHFFHVVPDCFEYDDETSNVNLNFSFRFKEVFQDWIFDTL
ncbi:alpha/beta hydrolase family protein [Gracilimonas sp.]|uniref:alpha/beta hydrolase family protein n=1 Tax=Gracilimonas sp. TaxID=1974203 RepID=UPI002872153F|nr:CocE/NonD family hydrolase [Gracilimonas sp.]